MRIKSNTIISGIFAAALLSAAVLAIHFLRLPVAPASDAERIADVLPPSPPAPWLPRLAAPRAVLVLDAEGVVRYREQVPEIAQEPDYAAALAAL